MKTGLDPTRQLAEFGLQRQKIQLPASAAEAPGSTRRNSRYLAITVPACWTTMSRLDHQTPDRRYPAGCVSRRVPKLRSSTGTGPAIGRGRYRRVSPRSSPSFSWGCARRSGGRGPCVDPQLVRSPRPDRPAERMPWPEELAGVPLPTAISSDETGLC
jgi:hypothetical protein